MSDTHNWVDAGSGYGLTVAGGKLLCRNAKGKTLKSVPKKVADGEVAEQLKALLSWLTTHEQECRDAVETWMLRSLPVPRSVLVAVWPDTAWRTALENLVVAPRGAVDEESAGFFRGADERGIGIVNLDGETVWIDAPEVVIPHPILLGDELEDYRELAADLEVDQVVQQLFRQTSVKPEIEKVERTSVGDFAEGKFEQLNFALGRCRTLGYRVKGGYAVCGVFEGGVSCEARYWIGAEYPEGETWTGDLIWVDEKQAAIKLTAVGPVAWSEGHRMAAAIYAGRHKEDEAAQ
jgi:hypothetical protein